MKKGNLYIAYYINRENPMNIESYSQCNLFIKNLNSLKANFKKTFVLEVSKFDDIESFVNQIDSTKEGTFIFYFNGSGHQEHEISNKSKLKASNFESLIFGQNEIKNNEILSLINKTTLEKITFNFILDSCNTGQFITHSESYKNVPIVIFAATDQNEVSNLASLTQFLNIIFYGISKKYLTIEMFTILFKAWFAMPSIIDKPILYFNNKLTINHIILN